MFISNFCKEITSVSYTHLDVYKRQGHSNAWGTNFGNRIKIENDVDCTESNITICKRTVILPETVDGLSLIHISRAIGVTMIWTGS